MCYCRRCGEAGLVWGSVMMSSDLEVVRVAKLLGGGLHNSSVVRGMVLKNDAVGSIKRVEKAKVSSKCYSSFTALIFLVICLCIFCSLYCEGFIMEAQFPCCVVVYVVLVPISFRGWSRSSTGIKYFILLFVVSHHKNEVISNSN